MPTNLPVLIEQPVAPAILQADADQQFVETWLARHESRHTRDNYARQARRFLAFVDKPLTDVRVRDLQAFLVTLAAQAPPRARPRRPHSSRCSASATISATCR